MASRSNWKFAAGFVLGGAFVALLGGRRRRAILRDKSASFARDAAGMATRRARDLRHRLRGLVYEAKARLRTRKSPTTSWSSACAPSWAVPSPTRAPSTCARRTAA